MITDLVQIRRMGEQRRDENLRFRKYIKSHDFVERQFRRAAQEIHDQIDCRECGECCRVGEVELSDRDIEKLARFLGIEIKAFVAKFVMVGEDGDRILRRTEARCVFLEGEANARSTKRVRRIANAFLTCCAEQALFKAGCGNSWIAPHTARSSTTGWKR